MLKQYFCFSGIAAVMLLSLGAMEPEIPNQFRIWGRKAPEKLSSNPIPGKTGIASLRIPRDLTRVDPVTNLAMPTGAGERYAANGFVPFPWHTMKKIYNITAPVSAEVGKPARAIATPGEYVPLGIAFRALEKLSCVEVTVAPFTDKTGAVVIPGYGIDLRRVMDLPVPLRNDAKKYQIEPRYLESFDEFDVLQVPPGITERFYLTVKVPETAAPGIVKSSVSITARGKET